MKKGKKYLIVGLGNPGEKYKNTRHNAGFWAIDNLLKELTIKKTRKRGKSLVYFADLNDATLILAKPLTYMNNSGFSVKRLASIYNVKLENIIIIYDDLDIAVGKIRIRKKGSGGTHNGMRSIISYIKSYDFPRIRVGIGKPEKGADIIDWVLGEPKKGEKELLNKSTNNAAKAVLALVDKGIEYSMQEYNKA